MAKIDFAATGSAGAIVPRTREDWLEWCWERNQRAIDRGWRHWLFIKDVDGKIVVDRLSSTDTEDVWKMLDDKPYVPMNWPAHEVRKHLGLVEWRLQRGMASDAFMVWSVEGRRARRKAVVEAELGKNINRD